MARILPVASLIGVSLLLTTSLLGLPLFLSGCGDNVTDCWFAPPPTDGTRISNGEFCMCTFFYREPSPPNPNPVGPSCNRDCRDANGNKIPNIDCNATPPF